MEAIVLNQYMCQCGMIMIQERNAQDEPVLICLNQDCDEHERQFRAPRVILEAMPEDVPTT